MQCQLTSYSCSEAMAKLYTKLQLSEELARETVLCTLFGFLSSFLFFLLEYSMLSICHLASTHILLGHILFVNAAKNQ